MATLPKKHFHIHQIGDMHHLLAFLDGLIPEEGWTVVISQYAAKRSLAINRLYWLWLGQIGREAYYSGSQRLHEPTAWHLFFAERFLGRVAVELPDGVILDDTRSTADLSNKDFSAYLNDIELFCGAEMDLTLPHPEDLYAEAMGRGARR